MTSTTYSRTSGSAVLPGTWAFVRNRHGIDPSQILDPAERYDYDTATDAIRDEFVRLAQQDLTEPPDFLRFALDMNDLPMGDYPGEGVAGAHAAPGLLGGTAPEVVRKRLNISEQQLDDALATFSGDVRLVGIPAGTVIYRTVGLTAKERGVNHGSIINRLLGEFWEPDCPDNYEDVAAWRSATAVLAEWNGDYGHLEVKLKADVWVLAGTIAEQPIRRTGGKVLPGGGQQFYLPNLLDSALEDSLTGRPIRTLIKKTQFRGRT